MNGTRSEGGQYRALTEWHRKEVDGRRGRLLHSLTLVEALANVCRCQVGRTGAAAVQPAGLQLAGKLAGWWGGQAVQPLLHPLTHLRERRSVSTIQDGSRQPRTVLANAGAAEHLPNITSRVYSHDALNEGRL